MTCVQQCSKVEFPFVSLCFENNLLLALDFLQLQRWDCLQLLPFLVYCCFCIRHFHPLWHGNKLVNQIVTGHQVCPLPAMWSSWFLGREGSSRCPVVSWDSTLQPYFVFEPLRDAFSSTTSFLVLEWYSSLHGMHRPQAFSIFSSHVYGFPDILRHPDQ